MKKFCLLLIGVVFLFIPDTGSGDILVTKDDMILNGKIIEDIKGKYIKFANYHGIFTIDYPQIKEIHKTGTYHEDVRIFKKMGKSVDEAEVKTNYLAGIEKLKADKLVKSRARTDATQYLLLVSPYFIFNLGKIESVLPYSYGAFLLNDIRFQSKYGFLPKSLRINIQFFYSENDSKMISAFRAELGTAWIIPFEGRSIRFNFTMSPTFGAGYYEVKGESRETENVKFNFSFSTGLEFLLSSWVISPQVRFDYIHDGSAPLYGLGFSLGAGYIFQNKSGKYKQDNSEH